MTAARWALYVGLTLAAAGLVFWLYLRREPPGKGRVLLASLRAAALALVLLLVFDPDLPSRPPRPPDSAIVLLDASRSMNLPTRAGAARTRWQAAVDEARTRGDRIFLFGEGLRPLGSDSLPARAPGDRRSLVVPALVAAAEAGARRVSVVTDAALEDAALLPGWLARLGLEVEWIRVGEPAEGLALTGLEAPDWAPPGEPVALDVEVTAAGEVRDSVRVVARQGGRVLAEAALEPPSPGRSRAVRLPVRPTAPAEGGYARLDIALEPGDAFSADDRRSVVVLLAPDPAGVALVSLQPDWEPRFLLPVLERALGLPVRGFLRTGGSWVRLAEGPAAGERVADADVARALTAADLVVLHAPGAAPPEWVLAALRSAPRLLVLPGAAPVGSLPLPLELDEPVPADWFLAPTVPPSPLASLLPPLPAEELAPLPTLRSAEPPPGAWTPLLLTRGRSGDPAPLLLAHEAAGRRWAVLLGDGLWRWAFRGGEPRQLYERFWAGVAGWVGRARGSGTTAVRPALRVLPAGEAPTWLVPGMDADSLRLQLTSDSAAPQDTVIVPSPDDSLRGRGLEPGAYRYVAAAYRGDTVQVRGEGELYVESWSPELARPPVPLESVAGGERALAAAGSGGMRRPLHTVPLPYVLVVVLLAAEWILRRRWGLR